MAFCSSFPDHEMRFWLLHFGLFSGFDGLRISSRGYALAPSAQLAVSSTNNRFYVLAYTDEMVCVSFASLPSFGASIIMYFFCNTEHQETDESTADISAGVGRWEHKGGSHAYEKSIGYLVGFLRNHNAFHHDDQSGTHSPSVITGSSTLPYLHQKSVWITSPLRWRMFSQWRSTFGPLSWIWCTGLWPRGPVDTWMPRWRPLWCRTAYNIMRNYSLRCPLCLSNLFCSYFLHSYVILEGSADFSTCT